jgi:hypothetical protein
MHHLQSGPTPQSGVGGVGEGGEEEAVKPGDVVRA